MEDFAHGTHSVSPTPRAVLVERDHRIKELINVARTKGFDELAHPFLLLMLLATFTRNEIF
ncbi:hypothetical protein SAMN05216338_1014148 [Bradyrhizobium sp. Rc2d]|nr:hypothetical protein SAMN05216338_1014148 [Bradyrhizobium sp. Rc2d]